MTNRISRTLKLNDLIGVHLSSMAAADMVRDAVLQIVDDERISVRIDFNHVKTMSNVFADALFGVLAKEKGSEWFNEWIYVGGIDEELVGVMMQAIYNRTGCTCGEPETAYVSMTRRGQTYLFIYEDTDEERLRVLKAGIKFELDDRLDFDAHDLNILLEKVYS